MRGLPAVAFCKADYDEFQMLISELPYSQARPLMDLIDGCVDRQAQECVRFAQQAETQIGGAMSDAFERWLFAETGASARNHFKKDHSQ